MILKVMNLKALLFAPLVLLALHAGPGFAYNGFDLSRSLIDKLRIEFGGQPRDGIPALDAPQFVDADEARHVGSEDLVLGISAYGEAKAYPLKILAWHEVVNDWIGTTAVVISYCPLCGSGTAFVAEIDGTPLTFGVSGLLYNSNLLLYDRETASLWSQLRRQAVSGPLAGARLDRLPVTQTTWGDWRRRHGHTRVLSKDTGFQRNYVVDPYDSYSESPWLSFSASPTSDLYPPKERVLGLEIAGRTKAYAFSELQAAGNLVLDRFAQQEILIRFDAASQSARAYDADGTELASTRAYWFAWYSFHPDTEIFEAQ